MSKRYFTSDLHFNSTLINKYAKRPYQEALKAGEFLVDNANTLLAKEDLLIHVGDFCLTSIDRHGKEEDIPLDFSPDYWKTQIKARLILLAGNHDDGHSFEADCKSMVLDLNQNYRNVSVGHYPSTSPVIKKTWSGRTIFTKHSVNGYQGWNGTAQKPHIHLCGHVHDKWLLKYDATKHVLNVNVGVDVWGYKPVRDAEITNLLDYYTKHCPIHDITGSFSVTRAEFENLRSRISEAIKTGRMQRKAEKLKKKGLTPEECERRKIEAMKKKGLM